MSRHKCQYTLFLIGISNLRSWYGHRDIILVIIMLYGLFTLYTPKYLYCRECNVLHLLPDEVVWMHNHEWYVSNYINMQAQSQQYALTIVALEEKLLALLNKCQQLEDENEAFKQSLQNADVSEDDKGTLAVYEHTIHMY